MALGLHSKMSQAGAEAIVAEHGFTSISGNGYVWDCY